MSIIKTQFDLHTRLFNNVIDGIADAEADSRANDQVNHLKWIAGHVMSARLGMGQFGGLEPDTSFDEYFEHGKKIDNSVNYPSLASIQAKWNEISAPISAGLGGMTPEMMAAPAPIKLPVDDPSMSGFVAFMMHHEAYHIGQMGILRKYVGGEAMKYS